MRRLRIWFWFVRKWRGWAEGVGADFTPENAVVAQMQAALVMLRQTIADFPEALWGVGEPNPNWRIAYHALFYTDLYLAAGEDAFVAWKRHRAGVNRFADDGAEPYGKAELLEYCDGVSGRVEACVRAVALEAPSGFSWLPMTRLEVHLYNLRHLAHHEGQLSDRLRAGAGMGVAWTRRGDLAPDQ